MAARVGSVEHDCHHHVEDGGEEVDGAPAEDVSDQSADGPRHQDAGQDPGCHRSHHCAAFSVVGQVTGQRNEQLPADGSETQQGDGGEEEPHRWRDTAQGERDRGAEHHHGYEAAPVDDVAERHDQQDTGGIANLCRRDEPA